MTAPDGISARPTTLSGKPRLFDQVRNELRLNHYSLRTEKTYLFWIRQFILHAGKRHPSTLGAREVSDYLSWLATERNVAAATQNQALSSLLFLYRRVLDITLPWLDDMVRTKRPVRLPTVLTEDEATRLLRQLRGGAWMMASLLYGAGLRQAECLKLRVKDIDFAYRQLFIRDAKGGKDRVTMLPEAVVQPLQAHLGRVRETHNKDLAGSYGETWLPHALSHRYPKTGGARGEEPARSRCRAGCGLCRNAVFDRPGSAPSILTD